MSWSSKLPHFAKDAKDGAPLVYGGVGKVHGSFVGSPWLCQGLRCLRMTAFWGRMRPFDNSSEDEAVRLLLSSFQNCHLERRERTRLRVCSRSRKTSCLPARRTCRRVMAAEHRKKAGPSTAQDRPRADDLTALDWITTTAPRERRVHLSFCEEPRLGAKGAANEDYRL
jgi:hypothetical protein